jgi:predicted small secreted protein
MKRFALIALILTGTLTVAACHTVEGAGHDITDVGRAGQSAVGGN